MIKKKLLERKMKRRVDAVTDELDGLIKDQIHPNRHNMVAIQIVLSEAVKRINKKYGLSGDEALDIHNTNSIKRAFYTWRDDR